MRYTPPARGARGVQREDVFAAADALIAEGKRPTIERVRLKIGRGSPNTVSPLLEHWFATLAPRLAGGFAPQPGGRGTAANGEEGSVEALLPVAVRSAAQALWDAARTEAQQCERAQSAAEREQLQLREQALAEAQAGFSQREAAFAEARATLDAALNSSQHEREALAQQVKEQGAQAQQVRDRLEADIRRLATEAVQSQERAARLHREHAEALAKRDQERQRVEERHAGQERHWLAELDRARQQAKSLEAELAKAQARHSRLDETWSERMAKAHQQVEDLREAQRQSAGASREELAAQARELAQMQTELAIAREREVASAERLAEEKSAHESTRDLLSHALGGIRVNESAQIVGSRKRARGVKKSPIEGQS